MNRTLGLVLAVCVPIAGAALKSATTYTFKDPKGVNSIQFVLDGRLEQIVGHSSGISGELNFDPAAPEALTGRIVVGTASVQTNHSNMTEHMLSDLWLNAAKFPTIEFKVGKTDDVKPKEGTDQAWTMNVTGDFQLHGVTKTITVPVTVTYLPNQLAKRNRGAGDLVVVRAAFSINRSDFGVDGNQPVDIVADKVRVSMSVGAFAPRAQLTR